MNVFPIGIVAFALLNGLIMAFALKPTFSTASGNWFPRTMLGFGGGFVICMCFAIFMFDGTIRLSLMAAFLALYLPVIFLIVRQHRINRRVSDGR
jgi:hypothetical protein